MHIINVNEAQREVMRKWHDALVSGDYTQARKYLHTNEGHCCLGVFEEVMHGKDCWRSKTLPALATEDTEGGLRYFTAKNDGFSMPSPETIDDFIYLGESTEVVRTILAREINELFDELAQMNDRGRSFTDIAAKIKTTFNL